MEDQKGQKSCREMAAILEKGAVQVSTFVLYKIETNKYPIKLTFHLFLCAVGENDNPFQPFDSYARFCDMAWKTCSAQYEQLYCK